MLKDETGEERYQDATSYKSLKAKKRDSRRKQLIESMLYNQSRNIIPIGSEEQNCITSLETLSQLKMKKQTLNMTNYKH